MLMTAVWMQGCGAGEHSGKVELTGELAEGRDAARRYCSTCHLPVDPEMLDKDTWKNQVLPVMARQLGLEVWQNNQYFQNERSAVKLAEWMKIVAYFDSLAPLHLPAAQPPVPLQEGWGGFALKMPAPDTSRLATTTLVAMDTTARRIYTSSAEAPDLLGWDIDFRKQSQTKLPSPATHILFAEQPVITTIGELKAYDISNGSVHSLQRNAAGIAALDDGLLRPLHTSAADFNRDGLTDYVVSAFGHNRGGLYLLRQMQNGKFEKRPLREVAGATQSATGDFNGDGWTDIVALFGHADEGIWLFTNNQKGGFTERNLLRFPPVYGSSSFQVADMDGDGQPDIVYTAGDNSDYSRILKPYHGIYIFRNKGDMQFEQSWFYPVNGATKAIAADFDRDGTPDIAAIAFFADLENNPREKFIYFHQQKAGAKGTFQFEPVSPPVTQHGRWICMDVNDWDGDGDPDVVLGNYSKGFLNQDNYRPDWNPYLPFIVLQNTH